MGLCLLPYSSIKRGSGKVREGERERERERESAKSVYGCVCVRRWGKQKRGEQGGKNRRGERGKWAAEAETEQVFSLELQIH